MEDIGFGPNSEHWTILSPKVYIAEPEQRFRLDTSAWCCSAVAFSSSISADDCFPTGRRLFDGNALSTSIGQRVFTRKWYANLISNHQQTSESALQQLFKPCVFRNVVDGVAICRLVVCHGCLGGSRCLRFICNCCSNIVWPPSLSAIANWLCVTH